MAQTKKTTAKNTKTNQSKKRSKSKLSKGKVYIPAYKIISLCAAIIVFCMILLLITTLNPKQKSEIQTSITERFEENKKDIAELKNITAPYSKKEVQNKNNSKSSESPVTPKPQKTSEKTSASKENSSTNTQKKIPQKTPEVQNNTATQTAQNTQNNKSASTPQSATKTQQTSAPKTENASKTAATPVPAPAPKTQQPSEPIAKAPKQETPVQKNPPAPEKKGYGFSQAKNNAQLIFVFDDGGQNLNHLEKFVTLPFPITVAVLPQIIHSKEAAQRVRTSGNEVILHQPMQSINPKVNPGPGAITPDMNENQVRAMLWQNIDEIWPIAGINNHEGSGITADAEKMETVLKTISERSIYFLDSRTNVETKVPYVASELGYTYYQRDIFLDNEKTKENALKELKRGLDIANKNGSVIMIGHVWSADFLPEFLQEVYPELKSKGYTFSVVSKSKALRK